MAVSIAKMTHEEQIECLFLYLGSLLDGKRITQKELAVRYHVSQGTLNRTMQNAAIAIKNEMFHAMSETGEVDPSLIEKYGVSDRLLKLVALYAICSGTYYYGNIRTDLDKMNLVEFSKSLKDTKARKYSIAVNAM